ncbi:MAG: hypothetical protein QOG13_1730 [Sphingomonadales bacterium]|nr:hypothetical protein [Sphingomonadales bacterium]MEA3042530.1 hypothetical protein [Sphingomonadales bacterium]
MALAALIAAYHESGEPGHLRATLPLAGRTVIERQARLAAAAGAAPVILFVERLPAALSAAIERLRRDRLPIEIVRSPEEAAEAVDAYDRILLIADGAIVGRSQLARLAGAEGAAVLTVPDASHGELYERIDAGARWAGAAAIDGALLRETAGMLRDWDLQSTLLRRTLQAGAEHLSAEGPVAILDRDEDLDALERRIVADADEARGGWADRLLAPIERAGTTFLMGGPLSPQLVGFAAALLTGLGAASCYVHWYWIGLAKLLVATPLEGIARRLARLRMQEGVRQSWWAYLIPLFAGAALVIVAYGLAATQGWGMILLAFVILAFLAALGFETEGRRVRGAVFLAERKGMTWLMLPFAAFGLWQAGLGLLFAYAAASFFWAQREAHAAPALRQD